MTTIKCPKCQEPVNFTISDAIDELGEVYRCPKCGWNFRYVSK